MRRAHYRNGDEIALTACGCDGCNPALITLGDGQRITHEHGCPEAWRDNAKECRECGSRFFANSTWATECFDCLEARVLK